MVTKKFSLTKAFLGLIILFIIFNLFSFSSYANETNEDNACEYSVANLSCVLIDDSTIELDCEFESIPVSDNNLIYLYALNPNDYEITIDSTLITAIQNTQNPRCTISLYDTEGNSLLYNKFAYAVLINNELKTISTPQYVSNPELLGSYYFALSGEGNKKFKSVQGVDFWNVEISQFCAYPETTTTLQLMNSEPKGLYTHPLSQAESRTNDIYPTQQHYYYMPNVTDPEAINKISEVCSLYASNPNIQNFIIGNEVNVRIWNYMSWVEWEEYVQEYANVFRVAYNAIKSSNANANVFICLDMTWDCNVSSDYYNYYRILDGKKFLTYFNEIISREGNIDWGVAYHPYLIPLSNAIFWDSYGQSLTSNDNYVSFQNLSAVTDFLQTKEMLSPSNNVRHFLISEIGVTNRQGVDAQAASLCASYIAAKQNPYVEEIIYLLAYCFEGIDTRLSGRSQEMFDNMDSENSMEYEQWAKDYIGINEWNELLK